MSYQTLILELFAVDQVKVISVSFNNSKGLGIYSAYLTHVRSEVQVLVILNDGLDPKNDFQIIQEKGY